MTGLLRAALAGSAAMLPALAATLAAAQTITLDPIQLEATRSEAAGQITIPEDQIEAAATGTLEDVFRAEPSVSVSGGIAIAERVFVNGIDQQQLAVTVDGAAQNNRMFHHTGTNVIDPGLLKAARVDAGVAGADAGPGALAGSIAFETKSALDLLDDGQNFGGNLTGGYADNGSTATGALTLYGRQGPVDALVYAKRATGDDFEDGSGRTWPYTAADMTSTMIKLGAEMNGWRAEYGASKIKDDALRPYRANFGGVIGGRPVPESRRYTLDQTTQTLSLKRQEEAGMFNPEFRLSHSESGLYTVDLPTADAPVPAWNDGQADTVSAVALNRLNWGGVEITAGVDVQNRKGVYDGLFGGTRYGFREDSDNTGIFAQARGTRGAFDYSAGLRYDWNRFTGAGGQQIDSDGASANASVTWHATDELALNAGYSTVFGGVPLASVYELWEDNELPGAYDAIRPTRAQNAILGADWTRGATRVDVELFRTKLGNARSGLSVVEVESKGWRAGVTQGWNGGSASLRFADTDVEHDGGPVDSYYLRELGMIPGRLLTLEARHEVMTGLTVGGVVQHAFDETAEGAEASRDFEGYTVVDVFAYYTPAGYRNVTLRAEISNLFDRDYVDRATYGGDYEEIIGQREPGRTVSLTANFTF